MKAPRHKFILGEGDDAAWIHLAQHLHSFIYAARDKEGQVVSLHQLVWAGARTLSVTPLGIIGWVTCLQNSENGEPLPLGSDILDARARLQAVSVPDPEMEPLEVWPKASST